MAGRERALPRVRPRGARADRITSSRSGCNWRCPCRPSTRLPAPGSSAPRIAARSRPTSSVIAASWRTRRPVPARPGCNCPASTAARSPVEALLVRDVQGINDPGRCLFFKDWARSDADRAGNGQGFIALSVFQSEGTRQLRSGDPLGNARQRGLAPRPGRAARPRRGRAPPRDPRRGRSRDRSRDRRRADAANRLRQRRPLVRRPRPRLHDRRLPRARARSCRPTRSRRSSSSSAEPATRQANSRPTQSADRNENPA